MICTYNYYDYNYYTYNSFSCSVVIRASTVLCANCYENYIL